MFTSTHALTSRVSLRLGLPTHTRCFMTKRHNATVPNRSKRSKSEQESTPEDIEKYLKMIDSGKLGFDPWAQRLPLFDLHVPTPLSTLPKDLSLRDRLKYLRVGLENRISNITTMFRIARNRSFPWNAKARAYSLEIFRTSSTKSGTYLEPLRETALDSYKRINTAIATNDVNTLRTLTEGTYRQRTLARMKNIHPATSKKGSSRTRHVWRLHSLASPVTCVSIRGQQGHFGRTEPLFGTRWVIQACMRLDTWQSLATFSPSISSEPAPKRVLEYLVFEKRMWYDEPWVVRDQLWEGMLAQPKSLD